MTRPTTVSAGMSSAWAIVYAVATMWNGSLLCAALYEIATTGNMYLTASSARSMTTLEALLFLAGFGCSLAVSLRVLVLGDRAKVVEG